MQKSGAGFAGFATWLDMTPAHPDLFVIPDPQSVIPLPWKPGVAWVAGDPWMNGKPVAQAPRLVLKDLMDKAASRGITFMAGVEPEFHLINADGSAISDHRDTQEKPCYDQAAIMRRYEVIADICSTMVGLGWSPYQNDHEDANGQFEINWNFNDGLTTADQLRFFKFMVKSIAEQHGLRATFMPKPFANLTGNGCHVHCRCGMATARTTASRIPGEDSACHPRRIISSAGDASCRMPWRRSPIRRSTATSASMRRGRFRAPRGRPNTVTYGGNNRTHMVRVPDEGRFEFRLPDGAANPYLMMAAILAAGLHGIDEKMDPGKRLDIDMYAEGHTVKDAKRLPLNLIDALRSFERDSYLTEALGREFSAAYVKLKTNEWNNYCRHLTQWERDTTLDC